MPPRKRITLPDHVKDAVLGDVALSREICIRSEEDFKIRIYLAVQQGVTTYEIADQLGVSQQVVSKWSRQGEQARNQRRGASAEQPGELVAPGG